MMELTEASVTLLVSGERITLEVHDSSSREIVLKLYMTPDQFASALGRLVHTPVESCYVGDFEKLNKTMENDTLFFPLSTGVTYRNRKDKARVEVFNYCPDGWQPDLWFDSQSSFFLRDGVEYARTTVRRWV